MKDSVFMITQLNKDEGRSVGRYITILKSDKNYHRLFYRICSDKEVKGMYTTCKEVLYT